MPAAPRRFVVPGTQHRDASPVLPRSEGTGDDLRSPGTQGAHDGYGHGMAMRSVQARAIAVVIGIGLAASAVLGSTPGFAAPGPTSTITPASARPVAAVTAVTATTGATSPPPPPVALPCASAAEVESWPLERQLGHLVMVGIPITQSARAAATVARYGLAGILVRGTPGSDTRPRLAAIKAAALPGTPAIIAVDEEGGRVQHLRTAVGPLLSAQKMAAGLTPAKVQAIAYRHAQGMRSLGFTMNFGPILDLFNGNANGIGDRAWSADPAVTSRYGMAFAKGLLDGGIVPVVKHFPGHGFASGDSHQTGAVTPPIDVLRGRDLLAFNEAVRTPGVGVMVAHLLVPGLDGLPASVSPMAVTGILRQQMGHQGLVVTDSLSMWAIRFHWPAPRAAELALRAGNDILLFDDEPNVGQIINALVDAVKAEPTLQRLVTAANLRILAVTGRPTCAPDPSSTTTTSVG